MIKVKGVITMSMNKFDDEKLEAAAEVFKGYGNPMRIRIIDALQNKKLRVMELSELLGYSQPIISQQLKILRGVGIVHKIREGRNNCYALTSEHYSEIIKCMRGCLGL